MSGFFIRNTIKWTGTAGFFLDDKPSFYVDPYKLAFPTIGDAILLTHDHPLHCDPNEVKWLRKGSTIIVCPETCASKFIGDIRIAKPGDVLNIKGANIKVMPAYTPSGKHEKQAGGVGYIITMSDGLRVYHTGDTSLIPEMAEGIADVVLVPIGGEATWMRLKQLRSLKLSNLRWLCRCITSQTRKARQKQNVSKRFAVLPPRLKY